MNLYKIQFYYGTDCRCEQEVRANDEVRALAKVMDVNHFDTWAQNPDFWIKITRL